MTSPETKTVDNEYYIENGFKKKGMISYIDRIATRNSILVRIQNKTKTKMGRNQNH